MDGYTALEMMAVEHKVRSMFTASKSNHFSICDVEALAKVLRITVDTREYNALRLLHCVDWGDMSAPLRREVQESVLRILSVKKDDDYEIQQFVNKLNNLPQVKRL